MARKKKKASLKATDLANPKPLLAEEEVLDVTVAPLVFVSVKKGLSTGVGDVLTDGTLIEPMQGAMGITFDLLDHDYAALNSGVFGHRVSCHLDTIPFTLTDVSITEGQKLQAVFEHSLIAEMREHSKPKKASRHSMTRAEFILSMLKELRQPYVFICPELHRKQPVEKQKTSKKQTQEEEGVLPLKATGRQKAVTHTQGLTVKGQPMTAAQAGIINTALTAAESVAAIDRALVAMVVSLIQESDVADLKKPPNEIGPFSMIQKTVEGIGKADGNGKIDPHDAGEVGAHYITAGFTGAGGANAFARANPTWSASKIATAVEGPEKEYPSSWNAEAQKIVEAFKQEGLSFASEGGASGSASYTIKTHTYEYERGQPGQTEDTFTCATRLANEVGWSFFIVGKRTIYLVNDDDLLKAAPRYVITPKSAGLEDLKGDVEVGHRTVIIHGKRQPKPSEAELVARLGRWEAPPGCVVELKGWGPFDGKWLVDKPERPLFDARGTVHLRAPAKPLEEPPWQVDTIDLSSSSGGESTKNVPSGIPAPQAGQYRNPPSQGPVGLATPKAPWNPGGLTFARWIAAELEWAYGHGWRGPYPTSGYRPGIDPHTASGGSEHSGTQYPHGAVDFGGPEDFGARASFFAHVDGYEGLPLIPAQFGPGGLYPHGDGGHASGTGH